MYSFLRPLLFALEAETAHQFTLQLLRVAGNFSLSNQLLVQLYKAESKPVQAFGLTFKNPVGLAAGYDKDGLALNGLDALGFGHIEIGTVTPLPQAGNPKPRIFRLVEDEALINRMGFPSRGTEFVQMRLNPAVHVGALEKFFGISPRMMPKPRRVLSAKLGVNLGRNKETPNEQAVMDYLALLQNFAPSADYLTINVSSPNTEGLRRLQARDVLENLLTHLHQQRQQEEKRWEKKIPLLVKLAPDLAANELDDALDVILRAHMDGVIAANTTLARDGLRSARQSESGGLSGRPLKARSEAVLSQIVKRVDGKIPVVSVGGIMCADDAKRRLDMGATLIQIYTGLVYRGPRLVREIVRALA